MTLTGTALEEREALFKGFGRAFFKRDIEALYQVVTPDFQWRSFDGRGGVRIIEGPDAIRAHFERQKGLLAEQRFHDVVYHHLADVSFMTFRMTEVRRDDGIASDHEGVERYTFRDGKIAIKDVYRKPAASAG
jgi:ketosteroid isomerase-like protein